MATAGPRSSAGVSPSAKWSLYAGGSAFLCGALLFLVLSPVATTLVKVLTLPTDHAAVLVPGSAAVAGAGVWWTVIERRHAYRYPDGAMAGLVTALVTVGFWLLLPALVYGPVAVLAGGIVILFVLVVTLPVAPIWGVSLVYARRRVAGEPTDGPDAVR